MRDHEAESNDTEAPSLTAPAPLWEFCQQSSLVSPGRFATLNPRGWEKGRGCSRGSTSATGSISSAVIWPDTKSVLSRAGIGCLAVGHQAGAGADVEEIDDQLRVGVEDKAA